MTVYRYVRLGLLRAVKVGGIWRVRHADLVEFRDAVTVRAADDAVSGRRRAPWAERLEARLIAGDAQGAWGVIEGALASGARLEDVYLDVLGPAMQRIGLRWANGELDIAIEHRASAIANRLVGRLGGRFARRGRTRGMVVVGAPAGELHALPVAMLGDILRQQGWDVSDLGGDVPASGFVHLLEVSDEVAAVALSVTGERYLDVARDTIAAIRMVRPTIPVLIGGLAVIDGEHARRLGADHFTTDVRKVHGILDAIVAPDPVRRTGNEPAGNEPAGDGLDGIELADNELADNELADNELADNELADVSAGG